MSRPIYIIDLTYFKKMFWFHNQKENINKDKDTEMKKAYSDYVTDKVFANMDLMVNDREGYGKEAIVAMLEEANFYPQAFNSVEQELLKIIQAINKAAWDPRCKVKLVSKVKAAVYQYLEIHMDLEATVLYMQKAEEEVYVESVVGDDIIDNPTSEQINDYVKKTKSSNDGDQLRPDND